MGVLIWFLVWVKCYSIFHSAKLGYNFRFFVKSSPKNIGRPILNNLPPCYVPFLSHHAWPTYLPTYLPKHGTSLMDVPYTANPNPVRLTGYYSQFPQGKPCFHYREPLFSLQGPSFHYRDFPVNPCTSLLGIAVYLTSFIENSVTK